MNSLALSKKISIVGAGGKMGSGIALLTLLKLSFQGEERGSLHLIDMSEASLSRLKHYLKEHLKKESERNIVLLREMYQDREELIENSEIVQHHMEKAMERVYFGTAIEESSGSDLIFEAVFEKIDLKTALLTKIGALSKEGTILTNTSSIPIGFLEKSAAVEGRIAGFHFYNPPIVQKLLEVVVPEGSEDKLLTGCLEIAKELGKTAVVSRDIAGFIGNGIFIREILLTLNILEELKRQMPIHLALLVLNTVTKDLLLRPMGIFQLIDYVGVDVALNIILSMRRFLDDPSMHSSLLEDMVMKRRTGGHMGDSGQKEGFFRYKGHEAEAVLDLEKNVYRPLDASMKAEVANLLGGKSTPALTWKSLSKDAGRDALIEDFILSTVKQGTLGSHLMLRYLRFLRDASAVLVQEGVASSIEDVSLVLKLGFYHLYGPDARFLTSMEAITCKGCCP
ncbi:3-hydroxyacyl-CoA dehydrogenase family protein [Estrella lausannensis]|uniref:Putative 3-hydroxyacyl-CoA dehydrogenase n=1 Tax=Estrella lausannensis TaxID=483423 RepID=A0A0H5E700_9BACT|nr:3-hydroxyacyl-CoA dehydrogenase family protein [Estrella lausannensis]CRX39070.1 Putative 3-hydroxyacyl-CoA dehydrogenase [Estrella lausannensis]